MTALNAHRYQFNCQTTSPLKLNDYSGSMLRGAFGHALRKQACVTNMQNCHACMLYKQCAYPQVFSAPAQAATLQKFTTIPNPFIIEPPALGERQLNRKESFSFSMVLIGKAIKHLPIIISAWNTALQQGLGKQHTAVKLQTVVFEPMQKAETIIYKNETKELLQAPEFKMPPIRPTQQLTINLLTPLHIKKQGIAIRNNLTGRDFLMALVRRYYLLQQFHSHHYQAPDFSELAIQASQVECQSSLEWYEWQRYSSRQKQKMAFNGVLGELTLTGELTPFLPLLQAGQWLHAGNKTTFGMGRYQIQAEL